MEGAVRRSSSPIRTLWRAIPAVPVLVSLAGRAAVAAATRPHTWVGEGRGGVFWLRWSIAVSSTMAAQKQPVAIQCARHAKVVIVSNPEGRHSAAMVEAWIKCDKFNAQYPIGTKVSYKSLLEHATEWDIKATQTRSVAWALPSGEPVVMIVGKPGGVSLDHVEVIGDGK